MIAQGIVMLVQGNLTVAGLASKGGGFLAQLPKDQDVGSAPSWTYRIFSKTPNITLLSFKGMVKATLQVDCYGYAHSVVRLAKAIEDVLNGFKGNLPDPDRTYVSSIFSSDEMDEPWDAESRTWRKMTEYEMHYNQL